MTKTNRFRASIYIDIFLDEDLESNIDDQRRTATLIAEKVKDSIEDNSVGNKFLGGCVYYPFGSLKVDNLDNI